VHVPSVITFFGNRRGREVNWPAICRALVDTGFHGYLAHEFVPTRDPLTSLAEAVALCDV
jgi:hydroxypyruvate isomerase